MTGPTQQAARNGTAMRVVVTSLAGMVAFVVGGWLWFPAVWISRGRDLVLTPLLFLLLAGFALGFALLNGNDPQILPWIVGVPLLLLVVMRFEGELDRFERFVIPYLAAIACVAALPASTRSVPLIPGGDKDSALVRADLAEDSGGPPPVDFEVDCSALPYAKGEERAFCYMLGRWAVLRHERGILVACGCGEFGGFVSWYGHDGTLRQTLVDGDVPKTLIADCSSLACITGVTHLSISKADVRTFRLDGDRWHAVATTPLARDVDGIDVLPDGSLRFELVFEGGTWRYRAGAVEPVVEVGR